VEPRKTISQNLDAYRPRLEGGPLEYFFVAHNFAMEFYGEQVRAIRGTKFAEVTREDFLREYAWVVHATGFNARVVGKMMPRLMAVYIDAETLSMNEVLVRALPICNNPRKVKSVWTTVQHIKEQLSTSSWENYRDDELDTPEKLERLPYVGPITKYHLARNIGLLEFVKPDLHLIRLANHWGYLTPLDMCREMRSQFEDRTGLHLPLGIVDLVLWYAASTFGTTGIKGAGR